MYLRKQNLKSMNYPVDDLHLYTLNVGLACHDGDWNFKHVRSPFARLYLVVDGKARIELPSGTYNLQPGFLYFIPPFTTHSYYCDSAFSHYYIHIYERRENGVYLMDEWNFPVEVKATSYDIELLRRLVHINPFMRLPTSNPDVYDNHSTLVKNIGQNLRRPFCDKVESRGIIFILFSRFLKLATPRNEVEDSRIERALTYIRRHVGEAIDVDSLAGMAYMTRDHFTRLFKRTTGHTPKAYILNRKLETAELLLVTTDNPIKQIALDLGFDDNSYFTKTFKRFAGITPQEYRQSQKVNQAAETSNYTIL